MSDEKEQLEEEVSNLKEEINELQTKVEKLHLNEKDLHEKLTSYEKDQKQGQDSSEEIDKLIGK